VYVHSDILILHLRVNHEAGAASRFVNELDHTVLSKFSSLPCVGDALQELLGVLGRNRWTFNWLLLSVNDDDWWLADVQLQPVCAIGMNNVQKIVHRIHTLTVG
jgi:hypothetical protein